MPSYAYTNGDGLAVIDKTVPNGAVEPVSSLDDALKQVKAYLKDDVAGGAKIQADVTAGAASITALDGRLDDVETDLDQAITDIAAGEVSIATIQGQVDSLVVTAGGSPVTCIVTMSADQARTSADALATVNYNTVALDTDSAFNVSTKIYTVPRSGLYRVTAAVTVETTASSSPTDIQHYLCVRINGVIGAAISLRRQDGGTSICTVEINRIFQLAITNTVEVAYEVNTASGTMTSNIRASAAESIFQISRLSA